jgi:lipopolysaccharide export system protein LptC
MKPLLMISNLWGKLTLYLPVVVMALLALGSWWLARNTPLPATVEPIRAVRQEPDYFLNNFSMKKFDAQGTLVSELLGQKARHFPATDILEIEGARMRSSKNKLVTSGQSDRAYSNGDGSEVQLVGNAWVVREGHDAQGQTLPRVEFRGEFLHAFVNTQQLKSHKPVAITRGADQFFGDALFYDHVESVVQLDGRVRVRFEAPRSTP